VEADPPWSRWLFAAALPFAAIALAAPFATWNWLAGLCLHVSWQSVLALLPALLFQRRRRVRAAILLLAAACGLWPWMNAARTARALAPVSDVLNIASANLYDFNPTRSAAVAAVADLDVDLLGLQEVLPADHAVLAGRWPYQVWTRERDLLASALLSRHPIAWSMVHDLEGFALVDALVMAPRGLLRVYVTHVYSPKRPQRAVARDRQLEQVARLVAESVQPVLLLGDFNLSAAAPEWRTFSTAAAVRRPPGIGPATWPAWLGPLGLDLDHIVGRDVALAPLSTFAIPGSDHRGLLGAVQLLRP
jgi:endonuclease/exonuclease/phosphatase (EEP) superfamily protein YafD